MAVSITEIENETFPEGFVSERLISILGDGLEGGGAAKKRGRTRLLGGGFSVESIFRIRKESVSKELTLCGVREGIGNKSVCGCVGKRIYGGKRRGIIMSRLT